MTPYFERACTRWPPFLKATGYLLPNDPLFWDVQYSLTPTFFKVMSQNDPPFSFQSNVLNDSLFFISHLPKIWLAFCSGILFQNIFFLICTKYYKITSILRVFRQFSGVITQWPPFLEIFWVFLEILYRMTPFLILFCTEWPPILRK